MRIIKPSYEILSDISEGGIKELKRIDRIPVIFDDMMMYGIWTGMHNKLRH